MSKITKDFLFELGTEELPPKALRNLAQSLLVSVESQLKRQKLVLVILNGSLHQEGYLL